MTLKGESTGSNFELSDFVFIDNLKFERTIDT